MAWKMTKEAMTRRGLAELFFDMGYGPLRTSRFINANFHTVRDWQEAWKRKRKQQIYSKASTEQKSHANLLFASGLGYRKVAKQVGLKFWESRDMGRRFRRQATKEKGEEQ